MIRIEGLRRHWGTFSLAVDDLHVPQGGHLAVLGPCGAGKTLLLETIAGHYRPEKGTICVDGRPVNHLLPERRSIGVIYQDSALFPHMSVARNIAFGLRYVGLTRAQQGQRVQAIARTLGIEPLLDVKDVRQLSGGEAQKVALARTIVTDPKVLLLDEPLRSLDRPTREEMLELILELTAETGTTVMHVTHDFSEASASANRCAVMIDGRLRQSGPIREVFTRPVSRAVAEFLGVANCWPARREADGTVRALGVAIEAPPGIEPGYLCARPEAIILGRCDEPAAVRLRARVRGLSDRSDYVRISLETAGQTLIAHLARSQVSALGLAPGDEVDAVIGSDALHFLPREDDAA